MDLLALFMYSAVVFCLGIHWERSMLDERKWQKITLLHPNAMKEGDIDGMWMFKGIVVAAKKEGQVYEIVLPRIE